MRRMRLGAALAILACLATTALCQPPEVIHYTFDGGTPGTTAAEPNLAVPGVAGPIGTMGAGLTYDIASLCPPGTEIGIASNAVGATTEIDTGWVTNIGTSDWTIGAWLDLTAAGTGTALQYVWGDGGAASWRCFNNGVAGVGNIMMRGGGMTDTIITGGGSQTAPVHVMFVYDSSVPECRGYLNGVLNVTIAQSALNIVNTLGTTHFTVGRYSGNTSTLQPGCKMDDFRFYSRALTLGEIVGLQTCTAGPPPPPDWETNDADGALDIDGSWGSQYFPIIKNKVATLCVPPSPATGAFNVETQNNASGLWEVALSNQNIVPESGAGIMLGTEILNLSVISTISFVNGGATLDLSPWPGGTFPGVTASSFSVPFALTSVVDLGMQGVATAPAAPTGFVLTQPVELHVTVQSASATVPGPTADDTNVIFDVTTAPTCWFPSGVSFNGTSYTSIAVSPNGRILFSAIGDTDFSPSVVEALGDEPFFGFWTDFNPTTAGTITVTNPSPGVLRADWAGVAYISEPGALNTFGLEIDDLSQIYSIDGLGGVVPNPITSGVAGTGDAQFLGLSVGNAGGATDPGLTTFTVGPGGPAIPNLTDMIYDYYDYLTGVGGLVNSLATPGLSEIEFNFVSGTGFLWTGL